MKQIISTNFNQKINYSVINYTTIEEFYNKTDEEVKEKILNLLKDFRYKNEHLYTYSYICPICYEESTDKNFLIDLVCKYSQNCNHKCCLNCWRNSLLYQNNNSNKKFHCFGCSEEVNYSEIIKYNLLTIDEYSKYNLKLFRSTCKTYIDCANCQNSFIYKDPNRVICPYCCYHFCPYCYKLNHSKLGLNCEEFNEFTKHKQYLKYLEEEELIRLTNLNKKESCIKYQNLFNELIIKVKLREKIKEEQIKLNREHIEKQTEDWIKKNTKRCPSCNIPIEKNKGCNHMTCNQCNYEFCWYCLEECKDPCSHFKKCKKGAKWFDDGYRDD